MMPTSRGRNYVATRLAPANPQGWQELRHTDLHRNSVQYIYIWINSVQLNLILEHSGSVQRTFQISMSIMGTLPTCMYGDCGCSATQSVPEALHSCVVGTSAPQVADGDLLHMRTQVKRPVVRAVTDPHPIKVKIAMCFFPRHCSRCDVSLRPNQPTYTCRTWKTMRTK